MNSFLKKQTCSAVLMVRPAAFCANSQTFSSNSFQHVEKKLDANAVNQKAVQQCDGKAIIYPMNAENRRLERRHDIFEKVKSEGFDLKKVIDFTAFENDQLFLEGTGSMVFDRINNIIYACLSPRTNKDLLDEFARRLLYEVVPFRAFDNNGSAIYHTNVMMAVGDRFAVICLEAIRDFDERQMIAGRLLDTGHEVIDINFEQMHCFAGNMLQLHNQKGESLLVMSERARESLKIAQLAVLGKYARILSAPVDIIEKCGGGGIRCMMAEVDLEKI